jgi:predicted nucleic acid-binding protein
MAASSQAGVPVLVPTAVLAEILLGDEGDTRVNQVLKKLQVIPLTDSIARSAARLKRLAGMTGAAATIEAIVVATSASAGGGVILTSDPDDIRVLASHVSGMRIRSIHVC